MKRKLHIQTNKKGKNQRIKGKQGQSLLNYRGFRTVNFDHMLYKILWESQSKMNMQTTLQKASTICTSFVGQHVNKQKPGKLQTKTLTIAAGGNQLGRCRPTMEHHSGRQKSKAQSMGNTFSALNLSTSLNPSPSSL